MKTLTLLIFLSLLNFGCASTLEVESRDEKVYPYGMNYVSKINESLKTLLGAIDQDLEDAFGPFVIIESKATENFVQFSQTDKDLLFYDIPVERIWNEDGQQNKESFHSENVISRLKNYLSAWNVEVIDTMQDGKDVDTGEFSGFRSITGDLTKVKPHEYGLFVLGIFIECFEESAIELNITLNAE
ncbi:MAG: hypothetical protein AAF065_15130 [Verrucomicrobiota bacterium]